MRPTTATLLALLLSAAPGSAQGRDPGAKAPRGLADEELAGRLREHVEGLAAADLFSGAVKLVRGDTVLLDRAWGEAEKGFHVPNRTTTRFGLASTSKMFTAVLVAELAEEGRLSLDDPVGRHLPDFPVPAVRERVTLRHLLTHTSGLGDVLGERWERSSRTLFRTVDDWLALLDDAQLGFEPGTSFRYSNAGYLLLGAVLERVTGEPFDVLLRERVLGAAGMDGAGVFARDEVVQDLAVGYTHDRFGDRGGDEAFRDRWWSTHYTNPLAGGPAGGVCATTEDLVRFFRALERGKLLPPERVAELVAPRAELGRDGLSYGEGFLSAPSPRGGWYGHAGDIWGVSTVARHYPRTGHTLVVLANYGDGAARLVAEGFDRLLAAEALPATGLPGGLAFSSTEELDPAERERLLDATELSPEERELHTSVALRLIDALNREDRAAYEALMAPGFLEGLDDFDPWKHAFADQLDSFGRIARAWAPRRGPLSAGPGVRFAGHAGGVSVVVAFEEPASGSLTFTLDDEGRVVAGSSWFKRGFAEANVAGEEPIFELDATGR